MNSPNAMVIVHHPKMRNVAHRYDETMRAMVSLRHEYKQRQRRRHVILAMLLAVVLAWAGIGAWSARPAQSSTGATQVTSYIVKPGDTLWSYASSITPKGQDVSETVDELIELNDLDSGALQAGQRIIVPNE